MLKDPWSCGKLGRSILFLLACTTLATFLKSVPKSIASAETENLLATKQAAPIFVLQDKFWVNLHHFLRAEAWRRGHGGSLQLPLAKLSPGEQTAWDSALDVYQDLGKRSFVFDETLNRMDNALAMQTASTLTATNSIDPKFIVAMNQAAPIYRMHRWNEDHFENEQWIASYATSIATHAPSIKTAIGAVFQVTPPKDPILVDVVRDVGPNLAYTIQGPPGFSGHTFISPQANSNLDVALDTIFHEISHTMDDPIIAVIQREATRQKVKVPSDMWHAMTLYTTYQLVRHELGRREDDPSYAPNASFANLFKDGNWPAIFSDLQANWLPYLNGHGDFSEALKAVVANAPHAQQNSAATPQLTRTAPLFDFHSNFWVNLHQVLFHEALLGAGKPDRRLQSDTSLAAQQMNEQEKAEWNAAIAFYSANFGSRKELFDDEMVKINDQLAKQPDDGARLNTAGLPSGVATVLNRAAPIYRKYWWQVHNKSNEDWIRSQSARVQDLGAEIAAAMTKDLHQQWPAAPIRVDVCYYVPEIGHAYTTLVPPHTTFSSSAPSLQNLNGFETLFHEASHTFADTVSNALFAECGIQKKNCGQLWHAILFYTAGVDVRRALPPADQASFTPYAYKYGVYTRGDWPKYRIVLEKDWQPYLDGKTDFTAAIRALVADLQQ